MGNKISIILPTLNRVHLIGEMLDSVLKQTFENWECLIIDDGSTDNTKEIVHSYTEKEKRFKYLQRSDSHQKGLPGARNYGLECAKGKYIIFFDDDDIAHPQNLEVCQRLLENTGADFCHYKKQSFAESIPLVGQIPDPVNCYGIGPAQIEQVVMNEIALASCTVMWKKECFASIRFNESLSYAEEWECYIKILLEGYEGVGIDEVLYYNRKHPESNTGEFWLGNEGRKASQVKAVKLIIKNLKQKRLLSGRLIRYFVQMGIFLKEKSIVDYVLEISYVNILIRAKYRMLYKFYPIFVIGHRTKKLIKKNLS
ncbi:glycosyltransferase family 2 protein [Salegentibacter sp. F188]|uniref:Glycosyltransferase family 2 protein n=1 Tax=Autumnicola patrickiae TaxID=3075591 RepID=A0ABU3DZW8_9FLAO|nr:glycosyltransferase family 2 protein [Salegentibacter sp. F188]MDT0688602.1 glycosyltransferase family 2 protein [Salegentibacter sp. F188]